MTTDDQKKQFDPEALSDLTNSFDAQAARNSKAFVATMVDISAAINACPFGKLKNIDIEDLRQQTGHIINYNIRGLDDPIPCDVEFVPQLYSHFRKPTLLVLKRIRKHLMAQHRRILQRLEREQAMERIMDLGAFDVSQKIRLALDEINRYQGMAKMVRGGGRKLDILMQALHVPSRARFELLSIDRIMRDPHHQRHEDAIKWIKQSKFKGNEKAVFSLINNGFQMLDNAQNKLLDQMEDLSGLSFPRDDSAIDVHRSWYSLGSQLPRGEDFVKSFTAEEKVENKIKRLTYTMVRVGWDAERMRATKDRFLVEINLPKVQSVQLSNLFFDVENKIAEITKPDGDVMNAIETDFENGMLSTRERDEAEKWVKENKIKLQDVLMEIYEALQTIHEEHSNIALPEKIEAAIKQVQSGLGDEKESHKALIESEMSQFSPEDLVKAVDALEGRLENPDQALLSELVALRDNIVKRINQISIKNIEFHKKVRDAYDDFGAYEDKVMELYAQEELLENARVKSETWLLNCYRRIPLAGLSSKVLDDTMDVLIGRMLNAVKKLDYDPIDADNFDKALEDALDEEPEECIARLDLILRELEAIPQTEQLLSALKDWEKDLGGQKIAEKEAFILKNAEKLQDLVDNARSELREKLNEVGGRVSSPRLRFEVFGLSDCYSESLEALLKGMVNMVPELATEKEGEQLILSMTTLEAQIIEAQRTTKQGGEAYKKLKNMEENGQLSKELVSELRRDLERNFSDLDQLLEECSGALKRVKHLQGRFGEKNVETDYLDVTLNINDLDRLKDVYEFIDTVTMEDIKRFCVAYNLKQGLLDSLFEKARKKDVSIPKEVLRLFGRKDYKMYREKRYISLKLKTSILKENSDIFEAEVQLLCHTLNLVKAATIRKKASYVGILNLLEQAKDGDHQVVRLLGLLWGRIQTRMFKFKPKNHEKNFEGNRQAMITDVKDRTQGAFERR
jgi:hypothetical protein